MPNRYVREAAIKSKAVNSLSWQGEVFWRRLINLVDDFGRFYADPELLRADVFPRQLDRVRDSDIPRLLAECEKAGLLFCFEAESKPFLVMNQWEKGRALHSNYPEPTPEIRERMKTSVYICKQMSPTPTPTPTPVPTLPPKDKTGGDIPLDNEPAGTNPNAALSLLFNSWNRSAKSTGWALPQCLLLSDKRRAVMKVRLGERFFIDNWANALELVEKSSFCRGINDRGWQASFDWFITRDVVTKIIEGKYNDTSTEHRKNSGPVNQRLHGQSDQIAAKQSSLAAALAASED